MNCVSENSLRAYQDGELSGVEGVEIETHLDICANARNASGEIAATSERVHGQMASLGAASSEARVDTQSALSRFKAQNAGVKIVPSTPELVVNETLLGSAGRVRQWRPLWIGAVAATILLCSLAFPFGRGLAQRFLGTLRIEKVQPVRLDFSALDGNRPLQEMLRQMVSDKVVVTADEKPQPGFHRCGREPASGIPGTCAGRAHGCAEIYRGRAARFPYDHRPYALAGYFRSGWAHGPCVAGYIGWSKCFGECAALDYGASMAIAQMHTRRVPHSLLRHNRAPVHGLIAWLYRKCRVRW